METDIEFLAAGKAAKTNFINLNIFISIKAKVEFDKVVRDVFANTSEARKVAGFFYKNNWSFSKNSFHTLGFVSVTDVVLVFVYTANTIDKAIRKVAAHLVFSEFRSASEKKKKKEEDKAFHRRRRQRLIFLSLP